MFGWLFRRHGEVVLCFFFLGKCSVDTVSRFKVFGSLYVCVLFEWSRECIICNYIPKMCAYISMVFSMHLLRTQKSRMLLRKPRVGSM